MKLTQDQHTAFKKATADFGADHTKALQMVRAIADVPENRYFTITSNGEVVIDKTRTREVSAKKLSKSDQ
jgi:hypothetical protein